MKSKNAASSLNLKEVEKIIQTAIENSFNYWPDLTQVFNIDNVKSMRDLIESDSFSSLSSNTVQYTFSVSYNSDYRIFNGFSFLFLFPDKIKSDPYLDYIQYNNYNYRNETGEKRIFMVKSLDYETVKEKSLFILNTIIKSYDNYLPTKGEAKEPHSFMELV